MSEIVEHFNTEELRHLPKVFVVQACRRISFDAFGTVLEKRDTLQELKTIIPEECILVLSSSPSRASLSDDNGGYFTQALVHVLMEFYECARPLDFTRVLRATNQLMATEDFGPSGGRQIGEFVSTLTRRLLL